MSLESQGPITSQFKSKINLRLLKANPANRQCHDIYKPIQRQHLKKMIDSFSKDSYVEMPRTSKKEALKIKLKAKIMQAFMKRLNEMAKKSKN